MKERILGDSMTNDEKVEYYINRFIDTINEIRKLGTHSFDFKDELMRDVIRKIVEANLDYILTDSYIYYLLITNSTINLDNILLNLLDEKKRTTQLFEYFTKVIHRNELYYEQLMKGYEKDLFGEHRKKMNKIMLVCCEYGYLKYDLFYIILCIIAGYVFGNNISIDNYNKYLDLFIKNVDNTIDELILQGICTLEWDGWTHSYVFDIENLITYVMLNFGNVQKEIR
jgi:hypothetical protein